MQGATSLVADLSICTRQTIKAAAGLSWTSGLSAARGTRSTALRYRHLRMHQKYQLYVRVDKAKARDKTGYNVKNALKIT